MPLDHSLSLSCFNKIQIGCTFLVLAHLGSPGKRAIKQVCVYIQWIKLTSCMWTQLIVSYLVCCCVADDQWESFNSWENFIPQRGIGHEVSVVHIYYSSATVLFVFLPDVVQWTWRNSLVLIDVLFQPGLLLSQTAVGGVVFSGVKLFLEIIFKDE